MQAFVIPDRGGLPVLTFTSEAEMDAWLAAGPATSGAWIRFAKKGVSWPCLTKQAALDVALCHGWIDGQAATFDSESFIMRFTPRRARSLWSQVNCARVERLTSAGRMREEGLRQVNAAKTDGRWEAAYAPATTMKMPTELVVALSANPKAAAAYEALPRSRRYGYLLDIVTKKKEVTRSRKIQLLVKLLEQI